MRRFLMLLVLVAAAVVALGFYRGWFHVPPSGTDEKTTIPVTVDREKLEQDKEKAKDFAKEKVQDLKQRVGENKANTGTGAKKERTPAPDDSQAHSR